MDTTVKSSQSQVRYVSAEELSQYLGGWSPKRILRMTRPSQTPDPIPHLQFDRRTKVFALGSPELQAWMDRHTITKPVYRPRRKKRKRAEIVPTASNQDSARSVAC